MRSVVCVTLTALLISACAGPTGVPVASASVSDDPACPFRLFGHTGPIESLTFGPDGESLVAGESAGAIRFWRMGESVGWVERTLSGHVDRVGTVAFSPDGEILASGSYDGSVRLWDPSSGRETGRLGERTGPVWSLAFAPDGSALAVATHRGTVEMWDPTARERLQLLECYPVAPVRSVGAVRTVSFDPDGGLLAAGCEDGSIRLWDVGSWMPVGVLTGHTSSVNAVLFAAGGGLIVSASSDGAVRIWDAETHEAVKILRSAVSAPVFALAVDPAGETVAFGDFEGTIELWEIDSGASLGVAPVSLPPVSALCFDPSGKSLVSAHLGGPVCMWPLECLIEDEDIAPAEDEIDANG